MKSPNDILSHHEQKHENSCVAWGLELVLKMHEKIEIGDYPLQNGADPCGYGFGQREQEILKEYGVIAKDNSFDLNGFKEIARSEAQKGFPLIFSVLDHVDDARRVVFHIWVAVLEAELLAYRSRKYQSPHVLSVLSLDYVFAHSRMLLGSDYRIHSLLHS